MSEQGARQESFSEKRTCERSNIQRKFKLYMEGGNILECTSTDISLGGIALTCKAKIQGNLEGMRIRFSLDNSDNKFDCTIVRHNSNYIAIELDRKQAASFGKILTKQMLVS